MERAGRDGKPALFGRIAVTSTHGERLALARDPDVPRMITTRPYLTGRSYPVDLLAEGSLND